MQGKKRSTFYNKYSVSSDAVAKALSFSSVETFTGAEYAGNKIYQRYWAFTYDADNMYHKLDTFENLPIERIMSCEAFIYNPNNTDYYIGNHGIIYTNRRVGGEPRSVYFQRTVSDSYGGTGLKVFVWLKYLKQSS